MRREVFTSAGLGPIFQRESSVVRVYHWVISHRLLATASLLATGGVLLIVVAYLMTTSHSPITPRAQTDYAYASQLSRLGEAIIAQPYEEMQHKGGGAVTSNGKHVRHPRAADTKMASPAATVVDDAATMAFQSLSRLGVVIRESVAEPPINTPATPADDGIVGEVATVVPVTQLSHVVPSARPGRPRIERSMTVPARTDFSIPLLHGLDNLHASASNALPLRLVR